MRKTEIKDVLERRKESYQVAAALKVIQAMLEKRNEGGSRKSTTLLYGYTCDRNSWHVYLNDGWSEVIALCYDKDGNILSTRRHSFADCEKSEIYSFSCIVPDKRLYPEACDFETCCILADHGANLPFTTHTERENGDAVWGKVI